MGERYGNKKRGKTRKSPIQLIFREVWARELGMNETYIYQFESESGAGENFNFWEPFSPKFETKYFIFDETYMFRIKTEHISERVQESMDNSSTSDGLFIESKPLRAIWMGVNGRRDPLDNLSGECIVWRGRKKLRQQLVPGNTYGFPFNLWFKVTNEQAPQTEKNALHQLCDLYFTQTDCDIKFCFENGQHIGGHRSILKARSPVFAAMFQHDMQESKTGQVVITDIEPEKICSTSSIQANLEHR